MNEKNSIQEIIKQSINIINEIENFSKNHIQIVDVIVNVIKKGNKKILFGMVEVLLMHNI